MSLCSRTKSTPRTKCCCLKKGFQDYALQAPPRSIRTKERNLSRQKPTSRCLQSKRCFIPHDSRYQLHEVNYILSEIKFSIKSKTSFPQWHKPIRLKAALRLTQVSTVITHKSPTGWCHCPFRSPALLLHTNTSGFCHLAITWEK